MLTILALIKLKLITIKFCILHVVFRVDSNKRIGLGHLNRCLSIAKSLKLKGVERTFVLLNKYSAILVKSYGHDVVLIQRKNNEISYIKKLIDQKKCHALVIDSKRKSVSNIVKNFASKTKIVLVDNLKVKNNVNLFILPGAKEQFRQYPTNSLVGLKYVLINPSFHPTYNQKREKSIFISFGSSDKHNITKRVVSAFTKIKSNFKIIVILGRFYKQKKDLESIIKNDKRFVILEDPNNLHEIMAKCSIGIIAFGITIYEAAFCKLPVFVISHSNENHISAQKITEYGWSKYLGKYNEINYLSVAKTIISTANDEVLLKKMIDNAKLIDGKGSVRIADTIIKLIQN